MKRYRLFLPAVVCIVVALAGCHSLVEDTFAAYAEKPVLNAVLQSDSIIRVNLSFTANLGDSALVFVENATVEIQSTEGWTEKLTYIDNGLYESEHIAKANETYTCRAKINGYPLVTASTTAPAPTAIGAVIFTPTASKDEEGLDVASIRFPIVNHPNRSLYWEVRMLEERERYNSYLRGEELSIEKTYIYMQAGNDLVLQNEALPLTVFSNKRMTGNTYEVLFYIPWWSIGMISNGEPMINPDTEFYIELISADESYYRYKKQEYLYETSGGTGFGSSTQSYSLYSNVKNGLGIFTSFTSVRKQVEFNK